MIHHDYHVKVYYRDIDQMGIVYYSRYLEYFESARTELLASIELDVTSIETLGVYLPVVHADCHYLEGAQFEDNLIVRTAIRELPKLRLEIEYEIVRQNENKVLVKGSTTHVFISKKSQKPVRPPAQVLNKLKEHLSE